MIVLHRLAHESEPFYLNPDLIVTVEACPDTVVTLATGARILICEDPPTVARGILQWRAEVRRATLRALNAEDLAGASDQQRS
jgi:flagellar protein FlbD